ncbi:MAG: hypothetical protein K8H88_17285, partial [Sandaracinaceae bacterium]|nr:hypothetical protein [Sandaracinaceae bacterium]
DAALETGPDPIDAVLRADERPGLLTLLTRIQADRTSYFEQIRAEWLEEGPSTRALREHVGEVERALEEHAKPPPTEIERKLLLTALPPRCAGAPHVTIEQGYLPGTKLHERVRRTTSAEGERYERTVKLGRGVLRIEVEEETSAEVFARLWELTAGKRVSKIRYDVPEGDRVWEIDAFTDRELWLAEIELASADEPVEIPEWLAPYVVRDVTDEDAYVNLNLAK